MNYANKIEEFAALKYSEHGATKKEIENELRKSKLISELISVLHEINRRDHLIAETATMIYSIIQGVGLEDFYETIFYLNKELIAFSKKQGQTELGKQLRKEFDSFSKQGGV